MMDAKVSVKQTNPNWAKEMAERVAGLAGKAVAAGFPKGSASGSETYDNGASVLDVAIWNQFGTKNPGGQPYFKDKKTGEIIYVSRNHPRASRMAKTKPFNVPARPFMDNAVIRLQEDKEEIGAEIARQVVDGEIDADTALAKVGLFAENAIREAITDDTYEPNSPFTIARKKSSKPLIDTGKMRQAVTSQVRDTGSI